MAGPGGKEVGRVNIRAVPDGSKFRRDLRTMLQRVERTVKANIAVDADTRLAEANLRKFAKDWDGRQVNIAVGATTAAASAAMRFVTRPRTAPVIVQVRKASIARAMALLSAFSGARLAGDLVRNLAERIQNLDRALPKAAVVSTGIANTISVVLNALGGVLATGQGVVQLLGLLGAAPGILAGMAVGATTLGLALADTKTQLAVLAPGFQRLQDVVSANFWARARQPIIDFVRGTLPELQAGLAATSTTIGNWATTVVQQIGAAFGGGRITAMFEPLIRSIDIAATGAGGFAQAIAILGQTGGSYLPRLAQWVADLSNRFGAFLLEAESSGALQAWIETGITAARELGSVLHSIGSIFSGLTQAAGGGGFGPLAAGLSTIAAIVNSEPFQSTLSTIFAGAQAGAAGLAAALGPIGSMLSTLAPVIAQILASSGQVLGQFLGEVAAALSSPAFSEGLAGFFAGILTGIQAIAPSLPAVAAALGSLLGFAGQLASVLGPVLGTVLSALAPILTSILTAVQPLLPVLGDALISIFSTLAPYVLQLVDVLAPLISMLAEQLGPILEPIISGFTAVLGPVLQLAGIILSALMPVLGPLLPLISQIATLALKPLGDVLTALMPLFQILADTVGISMSIIGGVISTISALITGDFEEIGSIWENVWNGILDFGRSIFNTIAGLLEGFINGAIDLINGLTGGLQPFLDGLSLATGGLITIKLGKIPHVALPRLETGADILGSKYGTPFIGGENYQAESVVNRGRMNRLIELANALAARALAGGGDGSGGDTFQIYEAVSAQATAMAVAVRRNRRRD